MGLVYTALILIKKDEQLMTRGAFNEKLFHESHIYIVYK